MSPSEEATYRKVTWRLLPFLFLCYVLAYLDRVNVGFAKLQVQKDLGFSDTVYGIGAGVFFIGYFLFEVPSNLILERVGARLWIARSMILWGMLSSVTMFVTGERTFYALRLALGVAEAGFFPGIILYLTYWYTRKHRARMVAGFMTAVTLSGVIGGPVDRRDRENRPAEPRLRIDHLAGRAGDRREPVAGLLPGVSRSAATICGGMLCHLERPSAARFSFLMSVPVLIAAAVLAVKDLLELPGFATYLPPLAAGFAASAVFGFASIHWLLSYLARHPMNLFAWYRLLIGAGCFLLYAYRT